ncbi:glutamate 5-kinase [Galbibacter sp.]|uniref:glutamate 5-kinase n=1 Tax=Galbibacter sp. TaxID=2918471 RepID=UPI003A90141B
MNATNKKRIVLKIGSNTLTKESDHISRGKIEDIANQVASLKDQYEFIIVSSGAIAAAKQFVRLEGNGKEINVKQALASIGQLHLMRIYQENFRELGLFISQCLLSYSDFKSDSTRENIVNTINILCENDYIPIINENDTVATDEIQFGDNDMLAAMTAVLLDADLLIIATNTNGIYTRDSIKNKQLRTITNVASIEELTSEVVDGKSSHGTGGMLSKVEAVKIANQANIETWILNGLEDDFIVKAVNESSVFTKILKTVTH